MTTTTRTAQPTGRPMSAQAQRFAAAYDEASQTPRLEVLIEELDRLHSMERRAQLLKARSTSPDVPDHGAAGAAAADYILTAWSLADFA
jgi:hypothetical protein